MAGRGKDLKPRKRRSLPARQCPSITAKGEQCRMEPPTGSTYCRNHDPLPEVRAQVLVERVKRMGGVVLNPKDTPVPDLSNSIKIREFTEKIIWLGMVGKLGTAQVKSINGLVNSLIALGGIELERRMAEVEAYLISMGKNLSIGG